MKKILSFLLLLAISVACKKEKTEDRSAEDESTITQYIADNKITGAIATGSGLYYVIPKQGSGSQPSASSDVRVKYKGYLTNGTVFDETVNAGVKFNLASVIKGWQEGIPLFKQGGKGQLFIPSALAYGDKAQNSIPANSVLIFDIELLEVIN